MGRQIGTGNGKKQQQSPLKGNDSKNGKGKSKGKGKINGKG
jgi:hypothetical protein